MFYWAMYFLSFVPLWIAILIMKGVDCYLGKICQYCCIATVILIVVLTSIATVVMLCKLKPTEIGAEKLQLTNVAEEKLVILDFLATFIIPLFAFDFDTLRGLLLFIFFFFLFGYLCAHHKYSCANIMLDVLGYRIYDCELSDKNNVKRNKKVISKVDLRTCSQQEIFVKDLNNDCYCFCGKTDDEIED